jgi:hypothetical protein
MKRLLFFATMLLTFGFAKAQNISFNDSTKKYEMYIEYKAKTSNQNDNFNNVEEWLVSNYTNKYSAMKLSNKEKGKIVYSAAFETEIFPSKGLISFNYTVKVNKEKINFFITNFAYTIIGQTVGAGVALDFESRSLMSKKKIIKETETKILDLLTVSQL